MTSRLAGGAEIDACPDCHGIWVDWFDGELAKVAHAIAPLELGTPSVGGNSLCPRCTQRLHLETIGTAHIQRCGECAGTFVPRAAFDDLVTHREPERKKDPTTLDRLLAVIRWLVHGPKIEPSD